MFRQSEGRQRPLVDGTVIGDDELSPRMLLSELGSWSASNRRIDSWRAWQRVQSGRGLADCRSNTHQWVAVDGVWLFDAAPRVAIRVPKVLTRARVGAVFACFLKASATAATPNPA
jgi:hypothetical protein